MVAGDAPPPRRRAARPGRAPGLPRLPLLAAARGRPAVPVLPAGAAVAARAALPPLRPAGAVWIVSRLRRAVRRGVGAAGPRRAGTGAGRRPEVPRPPAGGRPDGRTD